MEKRLIFDCCCIMSTRSLELTDLLPSPGIARFPLHLIPFNHFTVPDSIFLLKRSFYPSAYSFSLRDCQIVTIGRLQYNSALDKYFLPLLIQDETDSIRLTIWFKSDIYPSEVLSLKVNSQVSFYNCHVGSNSFTGLSELICFSSRSISLFNS